MQSTYRTTQQDPSTFSYTPPRPAHLTRTNEAPWFCGVTHPRRSPLPRPHPHSELPHSPQTQVEGPSSPMASRRPRIIRSRVPRTSTEALIYYPSFEGGTFAHPSQCRPRTHTLQMADVHPPCRLSFFPPPLPRPAQAPPSPQPWVRTPPAACEDPFSSRPTPSAPISPFSYPSS